MKGTKMKKQHNKLFNNLKILIHKVFYKKLILIYSKKLIYA